MQHSLQVVEPFPAVPQPLPEVRKREKGVKKYEVYG